MKSPSSKKNLKSVFLAGILPLIAFTFIESYYGTLAGLVAGMAFGIGEILWEWKTLHKVEPITWIGNGMLLLLGGLSLFTQEGIWFKLQPALLEFGTALFLWGSVIANQPLLLVMFRKQMQFPNSPVLASTMEKAFRRITVRMGFFLFIHAGLAAWAGLYWSTVAWAMLKGVVFTSSFIMYILLESLLLRRSLLALTHPGKPSIF